MNLNINCYAILGVNHESSEKEIKKSYYKLSFEYHPDQNKNVDPVKFQQIAEAYTTLTESREEYDKKSKFGKFYNEFEELFKIDMEYNHVTAQNNFDQVKNREVLDVILFVDPLTFDGTLEYPRFVLCKSCKGSGKDMKSKIVIKDEKGNVKAMFDADDGCDFCEGTGKDYLGNSCGFCGGNGKVGIKDCDTCKGERRVLGKQKLKGVVLDGGETKVDSMGHLSYYDKGKVGHLIIKSNKPNI